MSVYYWDLLVGCLIPIELIAKRKQFTIQDFKDKVSRMDLILKMVRWDKRCA